MLDDLGIYYDPTGPSQLEAMIEASVTLSDAAQRRAERLIRRFVSNQLTKYNLAGAQIDLPEGRRILVPGQVEDDASIVYGAGEVATNRALLQAVRDANPATILIYKPHPDVEAGLRQGAVPDAAEIADVVATHADPIALIDAVDEVWTMTSLIGFEALLRTPKSPALERRFMRAGG